MTRGDEPAFNAPSGNCEVCVDVDEDAEAHFIVSFVHPVSHELVVQNMCGICASVITHLEETARILYEEP